MKGKNMKGSTNAVVGGAGGGSTTYPAKLVLESVINGGTPQKEETIVNEAIKVLEEI